MHHITAALLQITVVTYYKLRQIYYKLQQNSITNSGSFIANYDSVLLQITVHLLQTTAKCYYKYSSLITNYGNLLLQITVALSNYYKLWQLLRLLQITSQQLLTNTQVLRLRKAFANGSSDNTTLSTAQFHKIGESRGFLGRLLGSVQKNILIPLGLTAAALATDAAFHKKCLDMARRY